MGAGARQRNPNLTDGDRRQGPWSEGQNQDTEVEGATKPKATDFGTDWN